MLKKVLMAGLMLTVMLTASACGKDSGEDSGTVEETPVESSAVEIQPIEEEAEDPAVEDTQSVEEETQPTEEETQPIEEEAEGSTGEDAQSAEEETETPAEQEAATNASASYIFSEMPVKVFEVTGLGVGPDVATEERTSGGYTASLVRQTPGENTFVLYCFYGGDEYYNGAVDGDPIATVHSPSGKSQWSGNCYTCTGGLEIEKYYGEISEGQGGVFIGMVDPWHQYIMFSEIFHADAAQPDTIYVIEALTSVGSGEFEVADNVIAEIVTSFEVRGATVREISVEEALARDNIVVSEGGTN